MSYSHGDLREAIGAYVLGQLDDHDPLRAGLVEHLADCADCQGEVAELAPLRRLLRAVDPAEVEAIQSGGGRLTARPPELDGKVAAALSRQPAPRVATRSERRRQERSPASTRRRLSGWRPLAAGALVGAAAATGIVLALPDAEPVGPTVLAAEGVRTVAGVTADVGLVDHTWGVELKLRVTGLPGGTTYDVMVIDDDGREFSSGEFLGVAGMTITCNMTSSVLLADADRFEVLDRGGDVVVHGDLPT